ncbi:ATP-binding protein [Sorangium sp. So ce726]|uniref:AAA family ATPase n=1 Tax=Sorangium sp. So ce726 TaxID=3133319 RepID=UPI003F61473D
MAPRRKLLSRKQIPPRDRVAAGLRPYQTFVEHLHDELDRLWLLFDLRLAGARPKPGDEQGGPEPDREKELADKRSAIAGRLLACAEEQVEVPLERLRAAFGLTPFEVDALLASLAPTFDARFGHLYGQLHDNPEKRFLTGELILDLLSLDRASRAENVARLHPSGALFKWKLVHVEGGGEPNSTSIHLRPLLADLHVVRLLAGEFGLHPQVARLLHPIGPVERAPFDAPVEARIARLDERLAEPARRQPAFVHLRGPDGDDAISVAAASAARLGLQLFELQAPELLAMAAQPSEALTDTLRLVMRDARIYRGALLLTKADVLGDRHPGPEEPRRSLFAALAGVAPLVFLAADDDAIEAVARRSLRGRGFRWIELALPAPTYERRLATWERELGAIGGAAAVDAAARAELAARHDLTVSQIRRAAASAEDLARSRPSREAALGPDDLRAGVRRQTRRVLGDLATPVTARHRWGDLVISEGSLGQLREICAYHTRRHTVLDAWGFGERLQRGLGIHALFCGPPGTGKTMAASILAAELDLELYRIDLSLVINKYIGETEKNLARIFREAASAPVILFFDEADALFARRTKVQDSHDRYANLETGYLLQRIEDHPGITILATNLSENLDQAFLRRMGFIIDFPFPDAAARQRILEKLFPPAAPLAGDVDIAYLGQRLQLAGGNLRNIALRAAFAAAERGQPIGMGHMLLAAKREYEKLGKPFLPSDFSEYLDAAGLQVAPPAGPAAVFSPFAPPRGAEDR